MYSERCENVKCVHAGLKSKQTFKELIDLDRPVRNVRLVRRVVPNQRPLIDIVRARAEAHSRTGANQRLPELPLRLELVDSHQQSLHADGEQRCQHDVKDCVEEEKLA